MPARRRNNNNNVVQEEDDLLAADRNRRNEEWGTLTTDYSKGRCRVLGLVAVGIETAQTLVFDHSVITVMDDGTAVDVALKTGELPGKQERMNALINTGDL